MVLEDLVAFGCTFANQALDAHAEANGQQFAEALARLHATSGTIRDSMVSSPGSRHRRAERGTRLGVKYPWILATATAVFGDQMQPIEDSRRAMGLATASCVDLETVEAIRTAL